MMIGPTLLPGFVFRRFANSLRGIAAIIEPLHPFLKINLKQSGMRYHAVDYLSMALFSSLFYFIVLLILLYLFNTRLNFPIIVIVLLAAVISIFMYMQNLFIPKAIVMRRVRSIERNLMPALRDMLVQLNSGVPLFDMIVNIANAKYGAVSVIFRKAAREITAGKSQTEVLDKLAEGNPSILFRRVIWQISSAIKSGASVSKVLGSTVDTLSEEQIIQIQRYGSQLSGLSMFYMLIAVIGPALGMTILILVSFFLKISSEYMVLIFIALVLIVVFMQIMFMGIIKARRSSLI